MLKQTLAVGALMACCLAMLTWGALFHDKGTQSGKGLQATERAPAAGRDAAANKQGGTPEDEIRATGTQFTEGRARSPGRLPGGLKSAADILQGLIYKNAPAGPGRVPGANGGQGGAGGSENEGRSDQGSGRDPQPGDRPDELSSGAAYRGLFTVTAYTAGYESTQKRKGEPGYGETASGTQVTEGRTIAADWRVLPKGTRVYIEGVGERTVEDKGGAVKGNHIDLYMDDLTAARTWGKLEKKVYVIEWGQPKA